MFRRLNSDIFIRYPYHRYFCSSNKSTNNNYKNILKQFFLKVHPDLFFQYNNVKNTNDQSLRQLQQFFGELKGQQISNKSYQLNFFYLEEDSTFEHEHEIPSISIQFDINSSSGQMELIYPHLKKAEEQIQLLFKTVGIKDEFLLSSLLESSTSSSASSSTTIVEQENLLVFVQTFSHLARERAKEIVQEERSLDIMITYFYMEHQVRVLFEDHNLAISTRKSLLRNLEKLLSQFSEKNHNISLVDRIFNDQQPKGNVAFDSLQSEIFEPHGPFSGAHREQWKGWHKIKSGYVTPETNPKTDDSPVNSRLEGVSIVFCKQNGIDLEGRLMLNIDKPKTWKSTLKQFKISEIIQNLQNARKRLTLEKEIANRLKILNIHTDYFAQNSPEYLKLLNNIIDEIHKEPVQPLTDEKNSNNKQFSFENQTIRVLKAKEEILDPWIFDKKSGHINIPVDTNYREITSFLENYSPQIEMDWNRFKINQRNLSQLELTVKRQFRLSRLKKHDDISMSDMVSCCKRLLYNHQPFLPYLHNIKLIVGKENKINQDGSLVIQWDFQI
ncbi:hypothetical protein DLAC_10449 [Tieghemostelium lacteum]|uniref:DUF4460 domain-containing protein n=1 Tax=Tieghemostelium lacteum TaxID=361077 RepID=A0A151Z5J2_TIELA|nr:hypothetical protein DLAC_10449 [Tieghemostelium lacteum]|eukprot:KYQ89205.1 hypothetical protein DLAC_10449 [Tieghemostelium lacteum]